MSQNSIVPMVFFIYGLGIVFVMMWSLIASMHLNPSVRRIWAWSMLLLPITILVSPVLLAAWLIYAIVQAAQKLIRVAKTGEEI